MRSRLLIRTLLAAAFVVACSVAACAQSTQVDGVVKLKQADGTEVPVVGANIDIYRTDINQAFHTKTDKKGHYIHAGLPFIGTYTVVVSAPGAHPTFIQNTRFTQDTTRNFTLSPGDGSNLTLDQVKSIAAASPSTNSGGGGTSGPSKEDIAKAEEMKKKMAEVEEKNKKIEESNATISRTFKAGNDALAANHLDEAIAAYKEGLATRPDEPALLTNLSEALRRRGVNTYNEALKNPDASAKTQGIDAAKKDWSDAADASKKALDTIKAGDASDPQQQAIYAQNKMAAISTRALAMKLVATKVSPGDPAQAQAAWEAYQEYIAAEIDPGKKSKLRGEALQTLFDAGATDLAATQARSLLTEDPDNVDANRILGLALFASGDKAKFQEAANYLQRYVDKAPDTDPLKASAKESLDYLKTAENVKPEKVQPTRTGPARKRP